MRKHRTIDTEEAKFKAFSVMCKKAVGLEKENAELKTRNKAQEESLEFYFLNNEKNEKCIADLEKENAELKKQQFSLRNERNTFLAQNEQYEKDLIDFNENLTEAKKIIKKIENIFYSGENALKRLSQISDTLKEAEEFLKEEQRDIESLGLNENSKLCQKKKK